MADYTQDMTTGAFVGKAECRVLKASGWIPVEERLPEVGWWYIPVTFWSGKTGVARYVSTTKEWYDVNGDVRHVIAWQPLPAPYVKPRRFVVGRTGETSMRDYLYKRIVSAGFYVLDYDNSDRPCADRIPTREAAEKIADIYEEAYSGE